MTSLIDAMLIVVLIVALGLIHSAISERKEGTDEKQ